MTRASHLRTKYGITEEQYDDMLQGQGGCCGVCRRPAEVFAKRLAVDHDHFTGEVRGVLCTNCNRYIVGRHRKPAGVALLRAAVAYLDRDYTGWFVPEKKKRKKLARKNTSNRTRQSRTPRSRKRKS